MIESGVGRTERAQLGQRRGEPRALAEPDDGEMRQPRTAFALVHAPPLEPPVEVVGERDRPSALVVEDEHADAPRLAVAGDGESGAPPPGPATPVTDTATSTSSRSRAPRAIASAVSADTAPSRSRISADTPSSRSLTSSA